MVVTEIGYPSSNFGLQTPWMMADPDVGCTGTNSSNYTAQADAFEVAIDNLVQYEKDFDGFIQFWYGQPGTEDYYGGDGVPQGPLYECGWTVRGKPAAKVVHDAFKLPS